MQQRAGFVSRGRRRVAGCDPLSQREGRDQWPLIVKFSGLIIRFNPWRGCTKVAAGCANCYAEATSKRNPGTLGIWGDNGTRVVASESMWLQPYKWNMKARELGERRRVFCASLADVFEDWQGPVVDSHGENMQQCPTCEQWGSHARLISSCGINCSHRRELTLSDVRARLFRLIDATPHLDKLLLTKRPENIPGMIERTVGIEWWKEHCYGTTWLGTSVSTQADADRNVPLLLQCRDLSPCLFVSYEPAIERVDFDRFLDACTETNPRPLSSSWLKMLDWVIYGGESGPRSRIANVDWARSAMRQCAAAGVPFFLKQLGTNAIETLRGVRSPTCPSMWLGRVKDPKGGNMEEWPEDLRVRQLPEVSHDQH